MGFGSVLPSSSFSSISSYEFPPESVDALYCQWGKWKRIVLIPSIINLLILFQPQNHRKRFHPVPHAECKLASLGLCSEQNDLEESLPRIRTLILSLMGTKWALYLLLPTGHTPYLPTRTRQRWTKPSWKHEGSSHIQQMKTWWQTTLLAQVPLSVNELKHGDRFILLPIPMYNVQFFPSWPK